MRKFSFVFPLFLVMMVLLIAGCGSSRTFSSRKYTAGNYVSHKHKPGKVNARETPEQESAPVSKDEVLTESVTVADKAEQPKDKLLATSKTALGMTSAEAKAPSSAQSAGKKAETKKAEEKNKTFKVERIQKYIADRAVRKSVAADEGDNSLDPVALVSFILGILGLVINILAISVIVATAEYVFALLFIAGMVLGIIGLVFGTQGLRRNHKNKNGTLNLVFSIIGTAFGAGAILTAFIFAFYTLILAIAGL